MPLYILQSLLIRSCFTCFLGYYLLLSVSVLSWNRRFSFFSWLQALARNLALFFSSLFRCSIFKVRSLTTQSLVGSFVIIPLSIRFVNTFLKSFWFIFSEVSAVFRTACIVYHTHSDLSSVFSNIFEILFLTRICGGAPCECLYMIPQRAEFVKA